MLNLTRLSRITDDWVGSKTSLRRKVQFGQIVRHRHHLRRERIAFAADAENVGLPGFDIIKAEVAERAGACRARDAARVGQRDGRVHQTSAVIC